MTSRWALGKRAFAFCDRCFFRYKLSELYYEVENSVKNGLRVCRTCLDPDHPQYHLGEIHIFDPEALRDPRPDISETASRGKFGFNPVGDPSTLQAQGRVGTVTIVTT